MHLTRELNPTKPGKADEFNIITTTRDQTQRDGKKRERGREKTKKDKERRT